MIGIIGAGNMAGALARGWGEPVLATDSGSGRAAALVAEVGGEALRDNAELARRADTILLGHKPYQLEQVAAEIDAAGKTVISVLGGTTVAQLQAAYPDSTVVRTMPNTPVAIRRGVTCIAEGGEVAVPLFERVGTVFVLPESQLEAATATMGVTPAYVALIAEASIDAAIRSGLPAPRATDIFLAALAGSAELLIAREGDTLGVRREVTSPGGTTARGLAALEANGLRTAIDQAMRAVIGR
ncbi:MAG TPA: pyrroline-5-carboxylate reductase [Capillimicrobium sp.]|nr:pyrroline-5-carboxylate reductase [Capillimicrobium sp.]